MKGLTLGGLSENNPVIPLGQHLKRVCFHKCP